MKIWELSAETKLFAPLAVVWDYFSSPANLNDITPDDMKFEVLTDLKGKKMYPGMVIEYVVRPILNIPMQWVTEITYCEEGKYFVDEQRFGPYAFWHHEHRFEQKEDHVLMTDTIHYAIGWGLLGSIAHAAFVRSKLEHIFRYRQVVMQKKFGQ
jgi:ligand-binding SRPBCC domain-containing protein